MKKYFYLLAISLCLGFVACGDDEPEPKPNPITPTPVDETTLLIGKWYENWMGSYDTYEYLTLRKDGTGSWLSEYYDDDGRLDDRDRETFTWTYDSSKKQLVMCFSDNQPIIYTVTRLTQDYLYIKAPSGFEHSFERND